LQDFIEIQENSLNEIMTNAMVLFRFNDLGTKIETSLNREVKKDTIEAPAGAPMQLRLRLHNRFNMDLNNVYAMEVIPQGKGYAVETSVNVYHDDFNQDDFSQLVLDVFKGPLKDVDIAFILHRLEFNFKNTLLHWKAAKEKQFIIDPEVDRLKEMHDIFARFHELAKAQLPPLAKRQAKELLGFNAEVNLERREKMAYAKSKILKVQHRISGDSLTLLQANPQLFSALVLEYCMVPLFLANELYVMSLIYNRKLADIRKVLLKRVQET
jgi:hypothetical protein